MIRFSTSLSRPSQQLVTMAIHDLRTPVTAIKGFGQLALRRPELPADLRQYLETILAEANRAAGYLEDLATVTRVETDEDILQPRPVDLTLIVDEVTRQARRWQYVGEVQAQSRPGARAVCDPSLTARAIGHLVRVATKYAGDEPTCLAATPVLQDAAIIVAARADALGAVDELTSVWPDPLPRSAGAAEPEALADVETGTRGLGLYLAGKIIEAQGGALWIDLPPRGGARFLTILPGSHRFANKRDWPLPPPGGSPRWS